MSLLFDLTHRQRVYEDNRSWFLQPAAVFCPHTYITFTLPNLRLQAFVTANAVLFDRRKIEFMDQSTRLWDDPSVSPGICAKPGSGAEQIMAAGLPSEWARMSLLRAIPPPRMRARSSGSESTIVVSGLSVRGLDEGVISKRTDIDIKETKTSGQRFALGPSPLNPREVYNNRTANVVRLIHVSLFLHRHTRYIQYVSGGVALFSLRTAVHSKRQSSESKTVSLLLPAQDGHRFLLSLVNMYDNAANEGIKEALT
ncbi:hypothetical protein NEOLEDRAFT_1170545 [Neolentinus lepideus HHB14362 ss-1]|uniref:Uncharacterized protein n=1 Tax=Neolentinus lepideus HHB14362 ss-1 TaxID=1314782 RepID=A0A165RI63_9AGAM|nr:hypothetical protein NEOLEDRAFT_1170545 [Neolentinus lepideus HHB14362 ss-1]